MLGLVGVSSPEVVDVPQQDGKEDRLELEGRLEAGSELVVRVLVRVDREKKQLMAGAAAH